MGLYNISTVTGAPDPIYPAAVHHPNTNFNMHMIDLGIL